MTVENDWKDECFCCETCGKVFRKSLFSISRSIERMHFYEEPRMPEAEVAQCEGIGTFCSSNCLGKNAYLLLIKEGVKLTYPSIGPIETCSKCSGPVDMTKFHATWTEEEFVCKWSVSLDAMQPVSVKLLAVACRLCMSPEKENSTSGNCTALSFSIP